MLGHYGVTNERETKPILPYRASGKKAKFPYGCALFADRGDQWVGLATFAVFFEF
jgi:hypothetical protein